MNHLIHNRGVQASAAAAVTIGALAVVFAEQYPAAWITLGAAWLVVTVVAVMRATRKAG